MSEKWVKPASKCVLVATTGAVLIVTKDGSVVLTPDAMREVVANGGEFADAAERARAQQVRHAVVRTTFKQ